MIKFENIVLPSPEQWESVIRGMRNPKNSWDRMDSEYDVNWINDEVIPHESGHDEVIIGPNDLKLMTTLAAGGPVHAKYRRMITVYVDITAPLYWWKEFDTYKVGTVANSCSTMHKIADKKFTLDDFSCEHLFDQYGDPSMNLNYGGKYPVGIMRDLIYTLNHFRYWYLETKDKKYWWQMIQLLPSSYNQKRTVMMNYEVLANIYKSRKNHKLDEWSVGFMNWIETLPYSELITGEFKDEVEEEK